jgi:hypothetical protein
MILAEAGLRSPQDESVTITFSGRFAPSTLQTESSLDCLESLLGIFGRKVIAVGTVRGAIGNRSKRISSLTAARKILSENQNPFEFDYTFVSATKGGFSADFGIGKSHWSFLVSASHPVDEDLRSRITSVWIEASESLSSQFSSCARVLGSSELLNEAEIVRIHADQVMVGSQYLDLIGGADALKRKSEIEILAVRSRQSGNFAYVRSTAKGPIVFSDAWFHATFGTAMLH